jgi:hypothetical protein
MVRVCFSALRSELVHTCQVVCLLLLYKLVNYLVLSRQLIFSHMQTCSELCVLVLQIVCCHSLLHYIVVESFSFLKHNSRSQLHNLLFHSYSLSAQGLDGCLILLIV